MGCLDIHDKVVIAPKGQMIWSGKATWQEDVVPTYWLSEADVARKSKEWNFTFSDSLQVAQFDSEGRFGPIRQSMAFSWDSIGHRVWTRRVRIERDIPGDDGAYAERMLAGIYEGCIWHFSTQVPGKIIAATPQPSRIDTVAGIVEWNIPLVAFVKQNQEFRVVWAGISYESESEVPKASNFGTWAGATIAVVLAFAWLGVRHRSKVRSFRA